MSRRLIFVVLLLSFAYSAMSQMLTPPDFHEAWREQQSPSVATDGENYFAVWIDFRSFQSGEVFGTRISREGTVIDRGGIAIAPGDERNPTDPRVAWNGTDYLVTWIESGHVMGSRVAPDGTILQNGMLVSPPGVIRSTSGLVSRGGTMFAVWQSDNSQSIATVIDANGIPMNWRRMAERSTPVITNDGFLILSDDNGRLSTTLLDSGANLVSQATVGLHNGSTDLPAGASVGSTVLTVWPGPNGADILLLDSRGNLIRPVGTIPLVYHPYAAAVVARGDEYVVSWYVRDGSNASRILYRRFDASGTPLMESPAALGDASDAPRIALASARDSLIAMWGATSSDYTPQRIRATADFGATAFDVALTASPQAQPAVAANSSNTLVVWKENTSDVRTVLRGAFTSSSRAFRGMTPFDLTEIHYPLDSSRCEVAAGENDFAAVWTDGEEVYARRLRSDGAGEIQVVYGSGMSPAIIAEGDRFLIAWFTSGGIQTRYLNADGSLSEIATIAIDRTRTVTDRMTLTHDESGYLVLISSGQAHCSIICNFDWPSITFVHLDANAQTTDHVAQWLPLDMTGTGFGATFARSGDLSLIIWRTTQGLRARRVDSSFAFLDDESGIAIDNGTVGEAAVVPTTGGWKIFWSTATPDFEIERSAVLRFDGTMDGRRMKTLATIPVRDFGQASPAATTIAGLGIVAIFDATTLHTEAGGVRRLRAFPSRARALHH